MPRLALAAALLTLAACAESEEASLAQPKEEGYNLVDPVSAPLADEGGLAIGDWSQAVLDDGAALRFGAAGAEPLFSIRCDEGEGVLLQRHGVIVGPGLNMMTIEAGGAPQRLAVNPVEGPVPVLRAAVPPNGELMAGLARPQGRLTVRVGNEAALVMPATPLIGEFVRGCSSDAGGDPQAEAANAAEPANTAEPAGAAATPSARTPG